MIREPQHEGDGMRILLVDDDSQLRSARAIMLSTHGYEVESASDTTEACRRGRASRPDLVVLALTATADRTFSFCQEIRKALPAQRVGFLLAESQYLCPVFQDGGMILPGEGPEDFLGRVQEILSGARDLPATHGSGSMQSTGEQL